MSTPPDDAPPTAEPAPSDTHAAEVADQTAAEPAFDPYRYGAPEQPVPPEYAPPGYVPPAPQPMPQPGAQPQPQQPSMQPPPYQPYAGGPYQQYPTYPGQPYYPPPAYSQYPPPRTGNGRAITALVLGIASVVFFWTSIIDVIPVVLAIVFGSIGVNDAKRGASGRNMAVTGIVLGVIGALLAITFTVVVYTRIKPCLNDYQSGSAAQNSCIRHKF
jgi:hypothetical protein